MNELWIKRLKVATALLALLWLASCGGGGSSGTAALPNSVEGTVQSGVTVLSDTQNQQIQSVQRNTDGSLTVTGTAGSLDPLQIGQIVTIPVNDAQGLPFGYAGKAVALPGSNQVQLVPAAVEDVFNNLKIDIDTSRDGAKIVGVIVAPGASASFKQTAGTQAGLNVTGGIASANGLLSGVITISQDFTLKKKGSSTETGSATLFGTIKLDNGKVVYQADFDPLKYPTNGGWATLKGVITADISGTVGISNASGTEVVVPAWTDLLNASGKNIWDMSWKFGPFLELSGLNADDKKGLIPLAGIVIAPGLPTQPFTGNLSAAQLNFYRATNAVILWVYIDVSGSLSVSGEADLLRLDSMHVERGYQLQASGNKFVGTDINGNSAPTVTAPYIKGSASITQTLGMDLVADVLVGGVRPMTVKAQAIAATLASAVHGEGGYQWSPQQQWAGSLCYDSSAHVDSSLSVQARIQANFDAGWLKWQSAPEFDQTWNMNWYTMPIASGCFGMPAPDTTPPVTTVAPSLSGTTANATTLSATINEDGTGYYLVKAASAAAPSVAAVQAGTSFVMTANLTATQNIAGLAPSTAYTIYFVAKDVANNVQAVVQSVAVTTVAAADVTPPMTTAAPSVYGTTGTATTLSVTINEDGTGYYLVQAASAAAPSVAAVQAGTAFAMTANVAATQTIGGLTPSTAYMIYFVAKDAANNVQAAVQSVAVTTPAATSTATGKLNDTGITWGANYPSGNNAGCSGETIAAQDCANGRDALAAAGKLIKIGGGAAGFDFTKLDANGNALPASASSWRCVRDNVTGLIWEVKTADGGLRDLNNIYTNYGDGRPGDASAFITAVNAQGLCGHNDWRMPTVDELISIVDYGVTGPTIDTGYFPNSPSRYFWSASPFAYISSFAWNVDFSGGFPYGGNDLRDFSYAVRLVRAGQ